MTPKGYQKVRARARKAFVLGLFKVFQSAFTLHEWHLLHCVVLQHLASSYKDATGRDMGTVDANNVQSVTFTVARYDPPGLKEIPEWQALRDKQGDL